MIKKLPGPKNGIIKKIPPPDALLKFSIKYFDSSDVDMCPPKFKDTYTQALMGRLKELSHLTPHEFETCRHKSWRIHTHIPKSAAKLEIWQGGSSEFLVGACDHCREARRE
jgi:hypothetical protein